MNRAKDDQQDFASDTGVKGRTPVVFISYSHDSPAHKQRVLDLAQQLRADGVYILAPPRPHSGATA